MTTWQTQFIPFSNQDLVFKFTLSKFWNIFNFSFVLMLSIQRYSVISNISDRHYIESLNTVALQYILPCHSQAWVLGQTLAYITWCFNVISHWEARTAWVSADRNVTARWKSFGLYLFQSSQFLNERSTQ